MRYIYILFLLIAQQTYSQTNNIQKADALALHENYSEEIELRKNILKELQDQTSEAYKEQLYKLRLAEFHVSEDAELKLKKIAEAQKICQSIAAANPEIKTEIGVHYFDALVGLGDFELYNEQLHYIFEYAKAQKPSTIIETHLAYIYYALGKSYLYQHNYEASISSLNKALKLNKEIYGRNSLETAATYKELNIVYSYTNNFQERLRCGENALEIYETIQPDDKFLLFEQYSALFTAYKYYGDVKKLEEIFGKMTRYFEKNKNDASFINLKHFDYPNLNPVKTIFYYTEVQHAAAFFHTEKAEIAFNKFIASMPDGKTEYTPLELNSIISYFFETGYMFHRYQDYQNIENYHKAKEYYFKALKFTKETGFEFGELQSYMLLSTLGVDYKQWNDVVTYTNIAFEKPDIEKFNEVQTLKHNQGMAYVEMNDYQNAFQVFEEQYQYYNNSSANNYSGLDKLLEAGNLFLELYKEDPKSEYLEKAYKNYNLSSVIFSRLYRGGEFSTRLSWYQSRINHGLLFTASELGKYQKSVVERLEINSSDFLWSSFVSNRKEPIMESSVAKRQQMDSLKVELEAVVVELKDKTLPGIERKELQTKLTSIEKSYANLEKELSENNNSFYQFSRTDFDLKKVQKGIKNNEVVVKYVLTDSSAFAYTIDNKNIKLMQLPLKTADLKVQASDFLLALKNTDPKYNVLSQKMYLDLISPLGIEKNKNLIIVPDSFLANIPFETLTSEKGKYLIQDHAISYAYSLKLYDIQKYIYDNSSNMLAAFSPDYNLQFAASSDNEDLKHLVRSGNYELLGAKTEVRNVNSIFGGDLYMSGNATKANFLENAANYNILHLAMHAVVNEEDADMSNLIFENDERLYLSEFYNMKIPAHLAVLSACDTGSGEIKEGEGVQSLSRAFTFAGVKSTVMSLWPVPDRETAIIMTAFYNNLKSGMSKDQALQKAKINYLETVSTAELKHPYYWAGFVVSGDVSPLKDSSNMWLYIGIVVLILLLVFLYLKKKKYL